MVGALASAPAAGTITRLRDEGDVVTRGRSLMSIDAEATAWVLYGTIPMYRDLGPGVADGRDVRQLEANLDALGYDPGTVDNDWTSATTSAVEAFQDDRGLTEDGTISRSEVVISDGAARVARHKVEVGGAAQTGAPVTTITRTTPVVTAQLDAGLAADVHRGDRVRVTMPDGSEVGGRVTRVGTAATAGENGSAPTVELRVALDANRRGRVDGAPVSISLETGTTKDALSVPVTALVATAPGRYAVELAGSRRLVAVMLGAFADDSVEVDGRGPRRPVRASWCRDDREELDALDRCCRTSPRSTPAWPCGPSTASASSCTRASSSPSWDRPGRASRRC